MTNTLIIITIIAYLAFMIAIGIFASKKTKNTGDYYLGGRRLGPFVTAMSAEASDMSSWLLMGLPGLALTAGIAEAFWTAIGLFIGTYLNWFIVAKRLRRYSEKTDSNTIPDFFSNRFKDKSGTLVALSAIIIIVFFVPYTASGFSAVGKLFNSLFGVDYHVAMIVGGLIISIYTVLGGFLAASKTDFWQSIVMTIALFVIIVYCIMNAGGITPVFDNVKGLAGYLDLTHTYSADGMGSFGTLAIASTLAWGLGYFGMPHILLRFMAIEDENKLKLSRRIASVWVIISMFAAIFIGILGFTFIKNNGIDLADGERIIIEISACLAKIAWPLAIVAGLILSGILAATMSTADSQMLAASSSMSENIVRRFFFKKMSDKTSMIVARCTVLLIAVVAIIFAWDPDSSVFRVVSFAWAGFGAAFGPLMLCALFWKRCNKFGAIAGVITGGAAVFIWKFLVRPLGGAFDIYELLPAFIVSLIFIVVVSLITPAPDKEITDEFESVKVK